MSDIEFDEKNAADAFFKLCGTTDALAGWVPQDIYIEGSRWQFDQDRLRIGLCESQVTELIAINKRGIEVAKAEIKSLEAQLSNRSLECPECGFNMVSIDVSKLMDKLAAAEANENKMMAALHLSSQNLAAAETSIKQGKQLSDADNKRIYELEARIRELEAELLLVQARD